MRILLLNDTRCDPNPGCQATVAALMRQLGSGTGGEIVTRPRGDGYGPFFGMVTRGEQHLVEAWRAAVDGLAMDVGLADALTSADLLAVNLEGTFHHHSLGALALGGALALAHRLGVRAWAVNGTVEGIDPWLIDAALAPCEHLAVREPRSVAWLADSGVTATAAADCVFSLEGFFQRAPSVDRRERTALYTPGVRAVIDPPSAIVDALADLEVLASAGWSPVFLQMEEGETAVAAAVAARGWPVEHAHHVAWNYFGAYLRQFSLLVSGRYHLLIFAAMSGVPAIARPSNTYKIAGLQELLAGGIALAATTSQLGELSRPDAEVPVIERAVIRRCQEMASLNVPRGALKEHTPGVAIEGLDWAPAEDLEVTLGGLRRDGPRTFRTTLDLRSAPSVVNRGMPFHSISDWQMRLANAGLDAEEISRTSHGGAVLRVTPQVPNADHTRDPVARRGAERAAPAVFLVSDAAGFDTLRQRAATRASWSFMVVTAAAPALASTVIAWCRTRGIVHALAPTVRDLTWASVPKGWAFHADPNAFVVSAARRGLSVRLTGDRRSFRLALFGASSRGLDSAAALRDTAHVQLAGFLDNDRRKWGTTLGGRSILAPDALTMADIDLIVISSMYQDAIAAQLIALDQGHKLLLDDADRDALKSLQITADGLVRIAPVDATHG